MKPHALVAVVCLALAAAPLPAAELPPGWPELPAGNAAIRVPAQEWPLRPGERFVTVAVHYPQGKLSAVGPQTGLMLTLHNWGGTGCVGTANPMALAQRYNVVALCVDYLQSGPEDSIRGPEPYDFGYLQALDALRGLYAVWAALAARQQPFHTGRVYATGGSGGGNVALMCGKLAPRTFAAIIDLCGMARLTDDIAFNLPGGSDLSARYSRDPADRYYLSPDAQAVRFVGHPDHLRAMRALGSTCRTIVVHGTQDRTCPTADAREMVAGFQAAGLAVEPHWIGPDDLDGRVFTSAGHALGNRTQIVFRVADAYLLPESDRRLTRSGPADFDLRDEKVRYATPGGAYVISYRAGYPVGTFEPRR